VECTLQVQYYCRGAGEWWNGKYIAVRVPSQYPLVLLVNVDPTEEHSVEK